MTLRILAGAGIALALAACSGGSSSGADESTSFAGGVRAAAEAVEEELGGPQEFFEITATPLLTNVFVAIDDGTTAVPYVFIDEMLEPPAPEITGVEGQTFTLDAIDFDASTVFSGIEADLPSATIDALSVEGGPGGFVRYVVSARSDKGGVLDIVVAPSGAIISVDPL